MTAVTIDIHTPHTQGYVVSGGADLCKTGVDLVQLKRVVIVWIARMSGVFLEELKRMFWTCPA